MTNYLTSPLAGAYPGKAGIRRVTEFVAIVACLSLLTFAQAQTTSPSPAGMSPSAGQPNEAEMMKEMMEMGKPNQNHKLLTNLNGTWNYTVKMWSNGNSNSQPVTFKGTAVRKSIMDGHYVTEDVSATMEMPGPDGKVAPMLFRGHSTEGYDNARQKFVATWYDSTGTGIMLFDGTYDGSTKTFTFTGTMQMTPTLSEKVRETLTLSDKNHMIMEWYENRGGRETKTMEIDYTRA